MAGQPTMVGVDVVVRRAMRDEHGTITGYHVETKGTQAYWHRNPLRRACYHLDTRHGLRFLRPFWKQWQEVQPHG